MSWTTMTKSPTSLWNIIRPFKSLALFFPSIICSLIETLTCWGSAPFLLWFWIKSTRPCTTVFTATNPFSSCSHVGGGASRQTINNTGKKGLIHFKLAVLYQLRQMCALSHIVEVTLHRTNPTYWWEYLVVSIVLGIWLLRCRLSAWIQGQFRTIYYNIWFFF